MIEHFIFQWVNFLILTGGLVYLLRRPFREFLSGRREKIRTQIVKTRHQHESALARHKDAQEKIAHADTDAEALKKSLIETGNFGREAIIKRAREAAERIARETEVLAVQEHARARSALSKEALSLAFEEASKILSRGIPREDQIRMLDESLSSTGRIDV